MLTLRDRLHEPPRSVPEPDRCKPWHHHDRTPAERTWRPAATKSQGSGDNDRRCSCCRHSWSICCLVLFPLVQVAITPLYKWNGLGPLTNIVGLDNFNRVLNDEVFQKALTITC